MMVLTLIQTFQVIITHDHAFEDKQKSEVKYSQMILGPKRN